MRALLISTYDLGHQPFGLASPAAWLRREGLDVICRDVSKERVAEPDLANAALIAFHLPMHTATRLAAPLIRKARALNPAARLCAYGLYAPLNGQWLKSLGVNEILGGEFEADLAAIARRMLEETISNHSDTAASASIPRLRFIQPDRTELLPLTRYAAVHLGGGVRRVTGYTEASRGCRHLCRHCPVVPVYKGQFRIVQREVVLADIEAQVAAGAGHITFGDPDFFNGPAHASRIVRELHQRHPSVSYDVTIKIEHLLRQRELLPVLAETGCLFITSAVESLDDRVLGILEKGHTRQDFVEAVSVCRAAGVPLAPTFVAFHPWTTLTGYCDLLDTIQALGLVDHVAPIQLAIRLLVPAGSRLLDVQAVRALVGEFDNRTLTYRWVHADSQVDALQQEVSAVVGRRLTSHRRETFAAISALAHERAGVQGPPAMDAGTEAPVPYVDEPWYCCAEPNPEQLTLV
jgi:hypothetical protein